MSFDPAVATQAYMDTLSASELALARDYTTGNHWLILAGLAVSALVTWLIVRTGLLEKLYAKLPENWPNLRIFVVAAAFMVIATILTLPYDIYTDWVRETAYGRTSQPLSDYLSQGAIGVVISAIAGGLFFLGVYFLIRRTGQLWWAWAGGLVAGFVALTMLLSPTLIEPLFNDFEEIPQGEVRDAVLAMGAEAGIPADRIFMFDGSRQSNNFTANVSGIGSSARIAISDVAMEEASLDEVRAVTGHEIGHYVLGHVWRMIGVISAMAIFGFFLTAKTYDWFARKFGTSAGLSDVRGIAVLIFVVGLFLTIANPALNAVVRMGERESDAYSMRTVNLPDAMAGALIKTAEYRYPLAGPVEEAIFYTHPSVERRIRSAMEWKAANMPEGVEPTAEPVAVPVDGPNPE